MYYYGDALAHWEGDTLVVETTNYINGFQGSSPDVKLTERFTRPSADYLNWSVTVDDPKTWTKPWTGLIHLAHSPDQIYEFACHEGNIAMGGILRGARMDEKVAAEKKGSN